jgi:hypothetical protein
MKPEISGEHNVCSRVSRYDVVDHSREMIVATPFNSSKKPKSMGEYCEKEDNVGKDCPACVTGGVNARR